jgi:hypothetical protein
VRRNCSRTEIDQIISNPEFVEAARERLGESFRESEEFKPCIGKTSENTPVDYFGGYTGGTVGLEAYRYTDRKTEGVGVALVDRVRPRRRDLARGATDWPRHGGYNGVVRFGRLCPGYSGRYGLGVALPERRCSVMLARDVRGASCLRVG